MKFSFFSFLLSIVVLTCELGWAQNRCGGGGDSGPKPLMDISGSFSQDTKMLPSVGSPQEFVFWEKSNRLVYRNENHDVLASFQGSAFSTTRFAPSSRPLSRITDPEEHFLAAESSPTYFDKKRNRWFHFSLDARPFRHLFWNRGRLYSISARINEKNTQYINVYEYRPGDAAAQPICKTIVAENGQHFRLAEGHSFPNVYFYRESQGQSGRLISIYGMDVSFFCKIVGISNYTREIAGPVKSVHLMPKVNGLVVEVDHPTRNLLWDNEQGCRYFNIQGRKPLILNYGKPLIATWNPEEGMTLIDLNEETKATLGWGRDYDGITELEQKDVWLANDGVRLFLTPKFSDTRDRWLFKMTLRNRI